MVAALVIALRDCFRSQEPPGISAVIKGFRLSFEKKKASEIRFHFSCQGLREEGEVSSVTERSV